MWFFRDVGIKHLCLPDVAVQLAVVEAVGLQGNLAMGVGYVGFPFLRETDQSRWIVIGCGHIFVSTFRRCQWFTWRWSVS